MECLEKRFLQEFSLKMTSLLLLFLLDISDGRNGGKLEKMFVRDSLCVVYDNSYLEEEILSILKFPFVFFFKSL